MTQRPLATSALASLLALGLAQAVQAAEDGSPKGKEKCFGTAKTGANDCATSKHGCAGQAAVDKSIDDWNYVALGTCKSLGGYTAEDLKLLPSGK